MSIDASWLLLAALICWTLADSIFPAFAHGLPALTYWWMAVAATLLFFLSIVFHEMAHSLVARRFGLPIRGITLFIFGGVAEMGQEPTTAKSELFMAIAGPLASMVLSGVFAALATLSARGEGSLAIAFWWLASINLMLAAFNLVPAFPLDGGRVLRAALWMWRGDFDWATRFATGAGEAFGLILIGLGIYTGLSGDLISGLWFILIGMFLRSAADSAYRENVAKKALAEATVARLMTRDPISAPPDISLAEFVEAYIYGRHHRSFPVSSQGMLIGSIGTEEAAATAREEWDRIKVGSVMRPIQVEDLASPGTPALDALARMQGAGRSRLWVVNGAQLVGVLALRDVSDYLSARAALENARAFGASRK